MALMNESVRQRLLQINQEFYNRFAAQFAATRYGAQPGWEQIIPHFPPRCQVLDLGCGSVLEVEAASDQRERVMVDIRKSFL